LTTYTDMIKDDPTLVSQTAKFTRMQDGTLEDWQKIGAAHKQDFTKTADPLARRDGATDEQIVVALCHDMAKVVNVPNHGPIVAEMLKPYVSEDSYHVLRNHQAFQGEHYYHYMGAPTDLRLQWKDEPWYDYAVKLVDEWDAPAFDPDFEADSLESFEPLMRKKQN